MKDDLFADQVPLLKPWLGEEEIQAVSEVIRSGWISLGPRVAEFEQAVADYVGGRTGVATNSGTTALHLALVTAGISPGDEVLCPSFTCMATANAIIMAGAIPRFADIDRRTYNLDVADAEARLTTATAAVMLVHQIGLPADIDAFASLCDKHRLVLIEDAATALGATYRGRPLGGLGNPTCFSFHPRKMITTGEGGMIITEDEDMAARARVLRSHGASISDLARHEARGALIQQHFEAGLNYRMTDMQAAVGLVQLRRLPEIIAIRAHQAKRYNDEIEDMGELSTPHVPPHASHAFSSYCVRVSPDSPVDARTLVQRMADRGISCRHGIQPLHREQYFIDAGIDIHLPQTEAAARETLFLPIYPGMTEAQQDRVIESLRLSLAA
jgi:dTDP-4-amino-4,6-dideoxygalactose transaminase